MSVRILAAVADRGVDLDVELPSGQVTALVGPNGAGKSTLLHLVAGLVRPTTGTVVFDDRTMSTPDKVIRTFQRHVALLTQRSLLFPHLSVAENVAFAPRAAGLGRAGAHDRALAELTAVGCEDLAGRRVSELSGGQAQRVAVARALAGDPAVVLLDEPMAGLDVSVAAELRPVLANRLRGRTVLLVTHELLDLWTLADHLVVIEHGRVVESGASEDLLQRPTSGFLASLSGMTLLTGTEADGALEIAPGTVVHGLVDAAQPLAPSGHGLAVVAPEAVSLHLDPPGGSPRNTLRATVTAVEPRGPVVRVRLSVAGQTLLADVTPHSVTELGLHPGGSVWAVIKAVQVRLYGR